MKKLEVSEFENIYAGGAWSCTGAVLASIGVTLGAAAITGGVALAAWLLAKGAATMYIVDSCRY